MCPSWQMRKWISIILVIFVSGLSLGCAFLSDLTSKSTDTPVPQPTQPHPTQAVPPTDTSLPTEFIPTGQPIPTTISPTQQGPVIPERSLGTGPWLLIEAEDGMWAVNPDGSGLTFLTDQVPITMQDMDKSASPRGGKVALITSTDPNELANLTLYLLSLPDSHLEIVTPLTSATTEPGPNAEPGSPAYNIVSALSGLHNLAWSPDGSHLAFMGAMNGPSVDLYSYSLNSGQITQLTDGPSQGIRPTWSPDGAYIVHAGVGSLGTGAGYDMQGIWAAAADDSKVVDLYPIPNDSGDEIILGWISPREFVVYTWNIMCGYKNLRVYDLATGITEILWPDFFSLAALSPATRDVLLSVDQMTAECNPGGSAGVYQVRPGQSTPLQLIDIGMLLMDWYPTPGVFLARNETTVFQFWPNAQVMIPTDAPGMGLPSISPDRQFWAYSESVYSGTPGLWFGEFGAQVEQIFPEGCWDVTWSPGREGFFFFSEAGLYFAPVPSFEPVLIGEGIHVTHVEPTTWVDP